MARVQTRSSVSLSTASNLQLQALAQMRGMSLSAWLEERIADAAAAAGVVVLPEDVERAKEARRQAVAERQHAAKEHDRRTEQARREAPR